MTELQEQIAKLIADAEQKAYARGWAEAMDSARKAVTGAFSAAPSTPTTNDSEPPQQRGRPAWAMTLVREAVHSSAGLRGVELVKAIHDGGNEVAERTVRTCLRRLRKNREIWQRNGRWYPKGKTESENVHGEAIQSPPH